MKGKLKNKSIRLRKRGLSYNEILKEVPVAKSTLSLWLRSVGLSKEQKQRLTQKKLKSIRRGWATCRKKRIEKTKIIMGKARSDVNKITINKKNLWLMGIMLYWAEGSKQKENTISQGVIFSNSDPYMVKIFIKWIKLCLKIPFDQIKFNIYIHKNHNSRIKEIKKYWARFTNFPMKKFDKIYFKKHNPRTQRKNIGNNYFGLLRIQIKKSTDLNRKISGWIEGICNICGVV